jgi:hypothetical protein
VKAIDEQRHSAHDEYGFEFPGGTVAITTSAAGATYRALYAVNDAELAIVASDSLAEPRDGLLLRGDGMWADHICETAIEHWSAGLEAFAVVIEPPMPDDVLGVRGDLMPFGFDLEWQTLRVTTDDDDGYAMECLVIGEVLVGADRIEIDGPGARWHRWTT